MNQYDVRYSLSAIQYLIDTPATSAVVLPCNILLKAVPTGTAFPYDGFTVSNQELPYMFTSKDNHIEFYGEKDVIITLVDCDLFAYVGLGNWSKIGASV